MSRSFIASVALGLCVVAGAAAEPPLRPDDFAWRAPVQAPAGAGLARLPLNAEALSRLQTPNAADLRLFGGDGQPVPFALTAPPPDDAPRQQVAPLPALPLHASSRGEAAPRGSVRVRVQDAAGATVWVQTSPGAPGAEATPGTRRLPAVLVDTREQAEPWSALQLQGNWPANTLVQFTVSTSADLANWTPASVQGRIYRFEGPQSPVNSTLELAGTLPLRDRYLRLEWGGQEGVEITSVTGLLAPRIPPAQRPALDLPAPRAEGAALEWSLPFATPPGQLALSASRPDSLVPVRILGRSLPSEPWRALAHTVVYRLGSGEQAATNAPVSLGGAAVRWLRVEATHGQGLLGAGITARVLFEPRELVFVAGANGPLQLAAGRARTPAAALPIAMLTEAGKVQVEALPRATLGAGTSRPMPAPAAWAQWLPEGVEPRTAGLWGVLLVGVGLLGAVAWSLLRQVKQEA